MKGTQTLHIAGLVAAPTGNPYGKQNSFFVAHLYLSIFNAVIPASMP
ncbi:MAG: hypothetical protein FWC25_00395 [Dehalococcoidia bacterium]|nr:hypothetical protein [Dehalococcoidia bacterium]